MATEKFANNAASILVGAITSGATSLVVASSSAFPAVQFRILVESELMIVTNVAGTTLTVTRGAEFTSPQAHPNGAAVTHVFTAGALGQTLADQGTDGAWIGLSSLYVNGWTDFGGGFQVGQYMKDRTGRVFLRGLLAPGTVTAGITLFTLPAGFRPTSTALLGCMLDGTTLKRFDVASTGTFVYTNGGAGSFLALDAATLSVN